MATSNAMTRRKTPRPFDLREAQLKLAIEKRRRGATYRAIAQFVGRSKSCAHRWTQGAAFEPPEQRYINLLVPTTNGAYTYEMTTERPPTPNQHKRGGRKRLQHIQDASWMQDVRIDILQAAQTPKTTQKKPVHDDGFLLVDKSCG